jgi:hypothetical protein
MFVALFVHCDAFARYPRYSAASLAPLFLGLPTFFSTGAKNFPV